MHPKSEEQLAAEKQGMDKSNYRDFNRPDTIPDFQDNFNFMNVLTVELTQEEYDKLRIGIINK